MSQFLGLDIGEKTVGVAISGGFYAQPLMTITYENQDLAQAVSKVLALCKEHLVTQIVAGLPKHMSNEIGESANRVLAFKELFEQAGGPPIALWDERLSTKEATRILISADVSRKKRKKVIDQMAAVIILQGYLDQASRRNV